jgi:hypothetical protein
VILKSETYNFHRLDLTRQAGFIVTVYDEDGLKLAATKLMLNACRGVCGSAKNRGQQNRRSKKKMNYGEWIRKIYRTSRADRKLFGA